MILIGSELHFLINGCVLEASITCEVQPINKPLLSLTSNLPPSSCWITSPSLTEHPYLNLHQHLTQHDLTCSAPATSAWNYQHLRIDSNASISSHLSSTARSTEWPEECTNFLVSNVFSICWFEQLYCASFDHLGTTGVHAHILLAFNVWPSTKYAYHIGDLVLPMSTTHGSGGDIQSSHIDWRGGCCTDGILVREVVHQHWEALQVCRTTEMDFWHVAILPLL